MPHLIAEHWRLPPREALEPGTHSLPEPHEVTPIRAIIQIASTQTTQISTSSVKP